MVWIFQDGHFASVLGFTPRPTDTAMPVLLFCIAFGLSMDYELFVISRIKERHDAGDANARRVTGGLARTGRIVSTLAALLAVGFFAFGTSHVSFIQFFGTRHRPGDPHRRDAGARRPRARVHARVRRAQLVRTGPAAAHPRPHRPQRECGRRADAGERVTPSFARCGRRQISWTARWLAEEPMVTRSR